MFWTIYIFCCIELNDVLTKGRFWEATQVILFYFLYFTLFWPRRIAASAIVYSNIAASITKSKRRHLLKIQSASMGRSITPSSTTQKFGKVPVFQLCTLIFIFSPSFSIEGNVHFKLGGELPPSFC
ncbi:hypothetical protein KSP39_PZI001147 [Platanthera zijinensis]|uniref:Uncharacterized protein n=1 Tax=Platanthera zijinensis TaxID=2320716 RepID=A0AAP0C1V6_9ASPA